MLQVTSYTEFPPPPAGESVPWWVVVTMNAASFI